MLKIIKQANGVHLNIPECLKLLFTYPNFKNTNENMTYFDLLAVSTHHLRYMGQWKCISNDRCAWLTVTELIPNVITKY